MMLAEAAGSSRVTDHSVGCALEGLGTTVRLPKDELKFTRFPCTQPNGEITDTIPPLSTD